MTYSMISDKIEMLVLMYDIDLFSALSLIGDIVITLGINIAAMYLVIGVADYIYQKLKFAKDMRMSKQEVKDEFKQSEGDPHVKGRIRQKMQEASRRRMMSRLPEADVVITNPTHLACAVKYDKTVAAAPVLVAKGADYLAQRIKDIAHDNKIPIVENKPLARMLYYNVELEQEIPEELYQMMAEVLAFVYGLENRSA
jgi:flagellar biosynthetic protein FlhB